MDIYIVYPITLNVSSMVAIFLINNRNVSGLTTHINVRHTFLMYCIDKRIMRIKFSYLEDNLVIIFTKSLTFRQFVKFEEFFIAALN